MRTIFSYALVSLFLVLLVEKGLAQTTVNPDISFIGDVRLSMHNDQESRPDEDGKIMLDFHELEIAATGYLNPFARADVCLGIHGVEGPIEIEEAYMTLLRGLPLNLQLKAGQYLPDFGKLNTQHPHQWSWIERPLMFKEMFGDDGFRDIGINISSLVPIGNTALGLSVHALKTGGVGEHHHHHDGESAEEENHETADTTHRDIAFLGSISAFTPLSDVTFLEVGASWLRAEIMPVENRHADLENINLKLKWRPDNYRSITAVTECLYNSRSLEDDNVSSFGIFTALDYQFRRRWDAGLFYDYTQGAEDETEFSAGYGLFTGFNLAEETTRFGIVIRRSEGSDVPEPYYTATLQALWSLGPHKPHPF